MQTDKQEIVKRILHSASNGAGIARIMFEACLTYAQVSEYVSGLVGDGFKFNDSARGKRYYQITPKGVQYLGKLAACFLLFGIGVSLCLPNPTQQITADFQ